MRALRNALLPLLGFVLAGGVPAAAAQQAESRQQITLDVKAPEGGESFACRLPVSVSHSKSLDLKSVNVIAKAYAGNEELGSTGIDTAGRPLVGDRDPQQAEYSAEPLQFDLTEEDCEKGTGLGVVLARCTFKDGTTQDCLDRIRFKEDTAGKVAFFVGEPKPPAR